MIQHAGRSAKPPRDEQTAPARLSGDCYNPSMRGRPPRPIYPERGYLPYNAGPDRSLEAVTLSEMVECIRPCDTDVWRSRFLTRTFWLRWSGKPPEVQTAMVAEEPLPLDDVRWDAFIAGYAQELSARYRLDPPGWALKPGRYLDHVWPIFSSAGLSSPSLEAIAPAPFLLEHGILMRDYNLVSAQQLIEGEGSVITWKSPDWRSDRTRPGAPTPQDALDAFEVISRRFEEDGVYAGLHLTGGGYFELARFPGHHFTTGKVPQPLTLTEADRDAIQEAGHTAVREAVADLAGGRGWPPDWPSRLPVPALDAGDPAASLSLFYHPSLNVRASSPAHLAGLLMLSGRRQDAETLSRLLPHLPDCRTPDDLTAAARRFAPASQTPDAELRATAEAALRCAAISA